MNSHEEYDNTETKCKDCGNTYGTRKSLWVHRQKKHPRIPNPSPCAHCDKTFFDKTELVSHIKTLSNDTVFSQFQDMRDQLEAEQKLQESDTQGGVDLSCHICHQRFHDKRVLSKHLRIHEQQKQNDSLFSNSPLAAMLADTTMEGNGASDYDYPTYKGQMVDNQFPCDMCPKTFPLVTALKVHRGWHFRSPDGRQITDGGSTWHPDSVASGGKKRARLQNPPVCSYCHATFASRNNLRRHEVEVHKHKEAKMLRENGNAVDSVFIEKEGECRACNKTFNRRDEWVVHKIKHARTMKPSTTFEWNCEICGKIFTRKERLLHHINEHAQDDGNFNSNDQANQYESNSQSSVSSHSPSQNSQDAKGTRNSQSSTPKAGMSLLKQPSLLKQQLIQPKLAAKGQTQEQNDNDIESELADDAHESTSVPEAESTRMIIDAESDRDSERDDADSDHDSDQDDVDSDRDSDDDDDDAEQTFPCDMCQKFFSDSDELRRHITSHIMNEPIVTKAASPPKSVAPASAANKSDEVNDEDGEEEEEDEGEEHLEDEEANNERNNDAPDESRNTEADDEQFDESDSEDDDEDDAMRNAAETADNSCSICGTDRGSYDAASRCMLKHEETTDVMCPNTECQLYFEDEETLHRHEALCHADE